MLNVKNAWPMATSTLSHVSAPKSGVNRNATPAEKEPEEISRAGLDGSCALCAEALELMLAFLGRVDQVPNIANLAGRIGFDYFRPLSGDLELTAQGWASYVGKSRLGVGPELGELQGDYLDSGATVRVGRPDMGLSLGVSNIADVEGNRFALGTPFAIGREQVTPLRPRTVRLGFDAAF